MKKETIYRKVLVSERVPIKEGRYIVSNGLGWFEVSYSKDFSFHEEFTDCSGVEIWLEETQIPSEEDVIMFLNEKYCGHASTVTIKETHNYILGFINNKK